MQRMVLETDFIKDTIVDIVTKKLAYYNNKLNLEVNSDEIYSDVCKEASDSMKVRSNK